MKSEIDFRYLFFEAKKKWWILGLISILCACLLTMYSYKSTKNSINSASYASTFVINIDGGFENDDGSQQFDEYADRYFSLIAGDEVLESVIKDDAVREYVSDILVLRNMIFFKSSTQGLTVNVYIQSNGQEESNVICKALEREAVAYLSEEGYNINVSQQTYDLGSTSIANKSVNGKDFIEISHPAIPVMSKSVIIKGIIAGAFLGMILGFVITSLLYICRGKVVYPGELENAGFNTPIIELNALEPNYEAALKAIDILFDKNDDIVIYQLENNPEENDVTKKIEFKECKSCIVSNDIKAVKKASSQDNNKIIIAIEADTFKSDELRNLNLMLENIGVNLSAVFFLK